MKSRFVFRLVTMAIPFVFTLTSLSFGQERSKPSAPSVPQAEKAAFTLPPLPFEMDALEPYITKRTLEFHHGKHHKTYVDKLNEKPLQDQLTHLNLQGKSLEDIIMASAHKDDQVDLFHAAAQVWNHTFYWNSMKKDGGGEPTGNLIELIKRDFGSFEAFKKQFVEAGTKVFGSGWVWLVYEQGKLKILGTSNADVPLTAVQTPLLTCDVWEHAYYLDYQNRRKDYVEIFLDHLVNWGFAAKNLEGVAK